MDSTIVVAIIITIGGGLFALLQRAVDKRYNKAKDVVEKNSATIADMVNVVTGFKELNEQYREEIKQLKDEVNELKTKLANLEGGSA